MSPLSLIVAAAFLAAVVFVLWRPQYAAVGLLVMFPLEQLAQAYFPIAQTYPAAINLSVALLAGFAVAIRASRKQPVLQGYGSGTTWLLWGLYGYTWMSVAWSPAPGPALAMLVPSLAYYFALMVLLPMLVPDVRAARPMLNGLLFVGAAVAGLILLSPKAEFSGGRLTIQLLGIGAGERGNPLALAEMGGMMVVVAALLSGGTGGFLALAGRIAAVVIGLGLAISSGSRGQVIAAVVSSFLCFPLARRIGSLKQFFGVGAAIAVLYLLVSVSFTLFIGEANERRWDVDRMSGAIETRFEHSSTLFRAWLDDPAAWLLGLGANAFNYFSLGGKYVHNIFVEVLCEMGLFGFALLMLAILLTAMSGFRLVAIHRNDPVGRSTAAAVFALCMYCLLLSMKQGSILGNPNSFYLWVVLARMALLEQRAVGALGVEDVALEEDAEVQPA